MTAPEHAHFLCDVETVLARIDDVDPQAYARSRDDLDGAVTWLGPFLTHGISDTVELAERLLGRRSPEDCRRLLSELGWREFFHRTWQREGSAIFDDMRHRQEGGANERAPRAVLEGRTGIDAVDASIRHLRAHGTMHNHARMWTAMIACNLGRTWWPEPARWLHHHLLDGDLASNTLSWQWIVGTFSAKRYVANQDNVNRFGGTRQHGTWLDVPYEAFGDPPPGDFALPGVLAERADADLPCPLRGTPIEPLSGGVALRSIWHLDPRWAHGMAREIVFVDTRLLAEWPLSDKRWDFIEHWADRCGAEIVHGSVADLARAAAAATLVRREHPACHAWPGRVEQRRWLYPMPDDDFPSFSRYWKQVRGSVGL